jgi:hypothetical protein
MLSQVNGNEKAVEEERFPSWVLWNLKLVCRGASLRHRVTRVPSVSLLNSTLLSW